MLVFLVILTLFVLRIENGILIVRSSRPVYGPGCYVDGRNYNLAFNETYSPKNDISCEQYTCDYDGFIYIYTCMDSFESNCLKIQGNKSLSYPDCCDSYDCSQSNKKSISESSRQLNSSDASKNITTIKQSITDLRNIKKVYFGNTTENENTFHSEMMSKNSEQGAKETKNISLVDIIVDSSIKNATETNVSNLKKITNDYTANDTVTKNMTDSKIMKNSSSESTSEIKSISGSELILNGSDKNASETQNIPDSKVITKGTTEIVKKNKNISKAQTVTDNNNDDDLTQEHETETKQQKADENLQSSQTDESQTKPTGSDQQKDITEKEKDADTNDDLRKEKKGASLEKELKSEE